MTEATAWERVTVWVLVAVEVRVVVEATARRGKRRAAAVSCIVMVVALRVLVLDAMGSIDWDLFGGETSESWITKSISRGEQ